MIDIQSIVTNGAITFSSCRVRSIGTYPARNLNKNPVLLQIGNDIQDGRGKEHRSALRKNDERFVYVKKRL